jgi:hypothetical protein
LAWTSPPSYLGSALGIRFFYEWIRVFMGQETSRGLSKVSPGSILAIPAVTPSDQ